MYISTTVSSCLCRCFCLCDPTTSTCLCRLIISIPCQGLLLFVRSHAPLWLDLYYWHSSSSFGQVFARVKFFWCIYPRLSTIQFIHSLVWLQTKSHKNCNIVFPSLFLCRKHLLLMSSCGYIFFPHFSLCRKYVLLMSFFIVHVFFLIMLWNFPVHRPFQRGEYICISALPIKLDQ